MAKQQLLIERDERTGGIEVKANFPLENRDLAYMLLGRAHECVLQQWMVQVYGKRPANAGPQIVIPDGPLNGRGM